MKAPGQLFSIQSVPSDSYQFVPVFQMFIITIITKIAKEVLSKPGPGHYPVCPGISKTGSYFLSNFKSSLCRTFGSKLPDTNLTSLSWTSQTPGPGAYPAPSEFGVYRAQDKYIKEYERTEDRRKSSMTARAHRKTASQMSERTAPIRLGSPMSKTITAQPKLKHNASEVTLSRELTITTPGKAAK